jgi:hypothetical protein
MPLRLSRGLGHGFEVRQAHAGALHLRQQSNDSVRGISQRSIKAESVPDIFGR